MRSRKVTRVKFHNSIFVPGVAGTQTDILPVTNPASTAAPHKLAMETCDIGVNIKINGAEVLVPWGNIAVASLGAEEEKK